MAQSKQLIYAIIYLYQQISQIGYEFKDRYLEFLNQPVSFIPFLKYLV